MLHASFMASPQGGVSAHYSGYAGYTPPPGAYNIHQHYQQPQHVDQRSSDSPLDFSAAASQYGNNSSAWNDEMRNYEDNKVIGFSDVNPSNGVDRTSSPDYRYICKISFKCHNLTSFFGGLLRAFRAFFWQKWSRIITSCVSKSRFNSFLTKKIFFFDDLHNK